MKEIVLTLIVVIALVYISVQLSSIRKELRIQSNLYAGPNDANAARVAEKDESIYKKTEKIAGEFADETVGIFGSFKKGINANA